MANRASVFATNWIANAVNQMPDETKLAAFVRGESLNPVFTLKAIAGYPQLQELLASPQISFDIEHSDHPIAKVVKTGELLVIENPNHFSFLSDHLPTVRSASLAPISLFSQVVAVLAFFSETNDSFDTTALVVVRRLCESLAHMAMASWKLEQLQQAQSHLSALSKIIQSMPAQEATPAGVANHHPSDLGASPPRPQLCPKTLSLLSPREQQVLKEFRFKPQIDAISNRLKISPHTVRNHLKSIFQKVGVHSRIELLSAIEGLAVEETSLHTRDEAR